MASIPYVKKTLVDVYQEELICLSCGSPMHHTGVIFTSNPAQHPHECKNGHRTEVPHPHQAYPRTSYEPRINT